MSKQRLRKASALIKKWNDSWGSLEHRFKHRQINKQMANEAKKEIESPAIREGDK